MVVLHVGHRLHFSSVSVCVLQRYFILAFEASITVPVGLVFFYLASPGLSSTTPDKALVYDSKILFPIVHLITVHMGAPGRTHDR